jgi:hypothetical protein
MKMTTYILHNELRKLAQGKPSALPVKHPVEYIAKWALRVLPKEDAQTTKNAGPRTRTRRRSHRDDSASFLEQLYLLPDPR